MRVKCVHIFISQPNVPAYFIYATSPLRILLLFTNQVKTIHMRLYDKQ